MASAHFDNGGCYGGPAPARHEPPPHAHEMAVGPQQPLHLMGNARAYLHRAHQTHQMNQQWKAPALPPGESELSIPSYRSKVGMHLATDVEVSICACVLHLVRRTHVASDVFST